MLWKNKLLIKILYCFKNRKLEFVSNTDYFKIIISNVSFYIPNFNKYRNIEHFWFNAFRFTYSNVLRETLITDFKTFIYNIGSIKKDIIKCLRIMNSK